jgi:hypothetical protein
MLTVCSDPRVQRSRRDLTMSLLLCILVLVTCLDATAQSFSQHAASKSNSPEVLAARQGPDSENVPKKFVDLTPAELAKELHELKHLQPAESQDMLPQILQRVGATVAAFFDNFSNTTCIERVVSIVDSPVEPHVFSQDAEFNYLALVRPGGVKTSLQEYRTDSKGKEVETQSQNAVVTTGFIAMSAHFHPDLQPESRFRFLGREVVKGQDTYVVAFAQRPEVARFTGRIVFHDKSGTFFRQGVAWIDPVSFTILRLRTDILQPELNIGLQMETTEVEYSEVPFKQGSKTLWLPREVTVTGHLNRYSFQNRHRYSDYRLFVVKAEEKQQSP